MITPWALLFNGFLMVLGVWGWEGYEEGEEASNDPLSKDPQGPPGTPFEQGLKPNTYLYGRMYLPPQKEGPQGPQKYSTYCTRLVDTPGVTNDHPVSFFFDGGCRFFDGDVANKTTRHHAFQGQQSTPRISRSI